MSFICFAPFFGFCVWKVSSRSLRRSICSDDAIVQTKSGGPPTSTRRQATPAIRWYTCLVAALDTSSRPETSWTDGLLAFRYLLLALFPAACLHAGFVYGCLAGSSSPRIWIVGYSLFGLKLTFQVIVFQHSGCRARLRPGCCARRQRQDCANENDK
jgi:hypothetical protein